MKIRRIIFVAAIVLLAAMTLVIWLTTRHEVKNLLLSVPIASNINFARQIDDRTVYYFTGSSFASFDVESLSTKTLSPQYALPTIIDRVELAKNGALFSASGYSMVDQLYTELLKNKLSPNGYYWWSVDFKTGKVSLLGEASKGADVRSAHWQDDNSFVYTESSDNSKNLSVIRQSGDKKTILTSIPDDGTRLVGYFGDEIALVRPTSVSDGRQELVFINPATKKQRVATKDILSIIGTDSAGSVVAIQGKGKGIYEEPGFVSGKLILYQNTDKKTIKLANNFTINRADPVTQRVWSAAGQDKNNKILGFYGDEQGRHGFMFQDNSGDNNRTLGYMIIGSSSKGLLVVDKELQLRLLSTHKIDRLPDISAYDKLSNGFYATDFSFVYVAADRQYNVYILTNPYEENRQKALDYFKKQGLDPNQIKIKWYAYDGVDTGFYPPAELQPAETPVLPSLDYSDAGD